MYSIKQHNKSEFEDVTLSGTDVTINAAVGARLSTGTACKIGIYSTGLCS